MKGTMVRKKFSGFAMLALISGSAGCGAVDVGPAPSTPEIGGKGDVVAPEVVMSEVVKVDEGRMIDTVRTLSDEGTRYFGMRMASISNYTVAKGGHRYGVCAARDFLVDEFEARKAAAQKARGDAALDDIEIYLHNFGYKDEGQSRIGDNIVMRVEGTDPQKAGAIVVGGHYDTISRYNALEQPGADDNASGVSGVLELARLVALKPTRATVYFVLFGAEEVPQRVGSKPLAKLMKEQYATLAERHGDKITLRAMFNLDMIGRPFSQPHSFAVLSAGPDPTASRSLAQLIDRSARTHYPKMGVVVEEMMESKGRWSDHMSFWEQGFASVRIREAQIDTDLVHTKLDTIEGRPDDPMDDVESSYIADIVRVTYATLLVLAGSNVTDAMDNLLSDTPARIFG